MISTADVLTILSRRAQRPLSELADAAGLSAQMSRWQAGHAAPTLEDLQRLARAGGLDISLGLAAADDSLDALVDDQLRLPPLQRIRRLLPADLARDCAAALAWVSDHGGRHVVIGPVAATLLGSPQRPRDGVVDLVPAYRSPLDERLEACGAELERRDVVAAWGLWRLPDGGRLRVLRVVPGTWGYLDLARDAVDVEIGDGRSVRAASLVDLLRIASASADLDDRASRPGVRAALARAPQPTASASASNGTLCGSCGVATGVTRPNALFRRGWHRHGGPANVWVCPACAPEVNGDS